MAIKYFTIFGGLEKKIDISIPLEKLIEQEILSKYSELRNQVNYLTGGYSVDHAILSGIALGDRKTTTAFKRAFVSFDEGMKSIDKLLQREIIEIESSQHFLLNKRNNPKIAKKLFFPIPFLRFWFGFISPIYKGIKEGNYSEFTLRFENQIDQFAQFTFEELALVFLQNSFLDDTIKHFGKYWDENIEIDLVAQTTSKKLIVGNCKYTNTKVKKSELSKLMKECEMSDIKPDMFLLFSKSGYSSELKSLRDDTLKLFTSKHLKLLLS